MHFSSRAPIRPLDTFVERLWLLTDAPPHSKERIAPSGTIDLVINLHENAVRIYDPAKPERCKRFSGAVVSGTHNGPFVIDTRELVSVMGVHFRPGGAFPFLGTPASELADTHVDLDALWGTSASELREGLCAANTPVERFNLLEKTLMAHLFRPLERHYAVRFAMSREMLASVNAVSFRYSRARSACHPSFFVVSGVFAKRSKQCDIPLHRIGRRWLWIVGITTNRI